MTSLAALLRAYPIGPGDTIFVDTGNYVATSDAVLGTDDAGTAVDPALIIGPTNGGTVVLDRNNTSAGIGVIDDIGGGNITLENLRLTGAAYGIDFTGPSTGVTLQNDSIYGNAAGGIYTPNTQPPTIANLTISDSAIYDNIGPGITLQDGVPERAAAERSGVQQHQLPRRRHRRSQHRWRRDDQWRRGLRQQRRRDLCDLHHRNDRGRTGPRQRQGWHRRRRL